MNAKLEMPFKSSQTLVFRWANNPDIPDGPLVRVLVGKKYWREAFEKHAPSQRCYDLVKNEFDLCTPLDKAACIAEDEIRACNSEIVAALDPTVILNIEDPVSQWGHSPTQSHYSPWYEGSSSGIRFCTPLRRLQSRLTHVVCQRSSSLCRLQLYSNCSSRLPLPRQHRSRFPTCYSSLPRCYSFSSHCLPSSHCSYRLNRHLPSPRHSRRRSLFPHCSYRSYYCSLSFLSLLFTRFSLLFALSLLLIALSSLFSPLLALSSFFLLLTLFLPLAAPFVSFSLPA